MDNAAHRPHIGGATKEASSRSSGGLCAQAIDDYFSGRLPSSWCPSCGT
ncbi:MAG: hypothetical protein ACLRWQ_01085 [Flavonifractor plautii]